MRIVYSQATNINPNARKYIMTTININNISYNVTDATETNRAMYEYAAGTDAVGNNVRIVWDFSDLENIDDIDDAGMYPWDDEQYISVYNQ